MNPNKKRLRRTMMFLNCQKPGLIKDPYIYKPDSIMLDLEDAVAEKEKDAARYSLYHALQEIDYHGVERVVRINGLDTPYWKEDNHVLSCPHKLKTGSCNMCLQILCIISTRKSNTKHSVRSFADI